MGYLAKDNSLIEPPYQEGQVGEDIKFTCKSWEDPMWFFSSRMSEPLETLQLLRIKDAQTSDSGLYFCHGSYTDESNFFIAEAELIVFGEFT